MLDNAPIFCCAIAVAVVSRRSIGGKPYDANDAAPTRPVASQKPSLHVVGTCSGATTILDFPFDLPFPVVGGKAKLKTSINAKLNDVGHPGLPPCASAEILSLWVYDQNSSAFANLGLWMP